MRGIDHFSAWCDTETFSSELGELKVRVCHIWLCSFTFGSVVPCGLFLNCAVQCHRERHLSWNIPKWSPGPQEHLQRVGSRFNAPPLGQSPQWRASIRFQCHSLALGLRLQHQRCISLGWTQKIGETGISLSLPRLVRSKQVAEALPVLSPIFPSPCAYNST